MDLNRIPVPMYCFSVRWLCMVILLLAVGITWWAPKDDNADAWSYHYYSGAQLLDHRMDQDYFGASVQGYLNPLVHVPFTAMVRANWPDRWVGTVLALFSGVALCLVVIFYRVALQLTRWELVGATVLSLAGLIVWTCVGTSVPDLFLQIPVLLALLCFFSAYTRHQQSRLLMSGFFLGAALGLKLTAVFFIPAFGLLLLLGLWSRQFFWQSVLLYIAGGLVGFLLAYGWWGFYLYQKFDNPFFPFFNNWFKSPYFAAESIGNHRFLSWNGLEQFMLPFRVALSETYTYVEMREPDLRPGIFVVAMLYLLGKQGFSSVKPVLGVHERNFLLFLLVSLYTWVFMSGNGRYAVGIFALLGGGVLLAMRASLPFKWFRTCFLLLLLLQCFVIAQLWSQDAAPFRFAKGKWGGAWFNVDFQRVLGKGNQLILTGSRSSYGVLVKDMGPNSAVMNIYGSYALDDDPRIERMLTEYEGRILGMVPAVKRLMDDEAWIKKTYFNTYSRFGLIPSDYKTCQFVEKRLTIKAASGSGFMFCPLIMDESARRLYQDKTKDAEKFFQRIESICPDLFSPKKYAITMTEQSKEKYYSNYEVVVYLQSTDVVFAKKEWSMMIFPLGSLAETYALSANDWRRKYCEPLRRSKAMSKE